MIRAPGVLRRHSILFFATMAATLAALSFGSGAALLTCVLALPVLAWRYDNRSGALFLLALLFVLAVTILAILIGLVAIVHGR